MITVELPHAVAVFTTRDGGVSQGPYASLNVGVLTGDEPANVMENRRLLAEQVGLDPAAIAMGRQVHGVAIERWGAPPDRDRHGFTNPEAAFPEVDGHTTTRHGLGLVVQGADCFPVALASPLRVAMLHCGWRSVADGIVEHALNLFETSPTAVVGPGIGSCCFEVGQDVASQFEEPAVSDGMLDLRGVIAAKLHGAGVQTVEHVYMCTSCREDLFFSYRRDGGVTGRQCGIVWRP